MSFEEALEIAKRELECDELESRDGWVRHLFKKDENGEMRHGWWLEWTHDISRKRRPCPVWVFRVRRAGRGMKEGW